MDVQFYGANCLTIGNRQMRIVIDDNLADLGKKSITKDGDIVLFTGPHGSPAADAKIVIDHPGEYEVSEVSIYGIALRGHMEESDRRDVIAYKIIADDVRYVVLGHVYPELSEKQLEQIGSIDVLFVPVGGNGFTLDSVGALKLIKKIEPKIVVPTHYDDASLEFVVPQQTIEQAASGLSMEPKEAIEKLRVKPADLTDVTQLVVLKPAS